MHAHLASILVLAGIGFSTPAKQSYDALTFDAPPGVRREIAGGIGYVEEGKGRFFQAAIYGAIAGHGDPAKDFAAEWDALLGKPYALPLPAAAATDAGAGWKVTRVSAKPKQADGHFFSQLAVFSGHGKRVTVLVNHNDEKRYAAKADAFLASIALTSLAAPAVANASPPPPAANAAGTPALTGRAWHKSAASYSMYGYDFTGAEIAKIGNSGYVKSTYRFAPDGTYTFVTELSTKYDEIWFLEESGTWSQKGSVLDVTPKKGTKTKRNKAGAVQGKPEAFTGETASYKTQLHWFDGIGEWNLVLTPVSGKQTKRDGEFASNAAFPSSYLYGNLPPQ